MVNNKSEMERKNFEEIKEWKLRINNVKGIMFVWSFTSRYRVPFGIEKREFRQDEYTVRRVQEILQKGGGVKDEETLMKQRPGIIDTGVHLAELKYCEGGDTVFEELITKGWKISDLWYEIRESEDSKIKGKKHKKFRVKLILSREGKELELSEVSKRDLKKLLRGTWITHIWDNTKTIHQGFTLSYTFLQKHIRATAKIILVLPDELLER